MEREQPVNLEAKRFFHNPYLHHLPSVSESSLTQMEVQLAHFVDEWEGNVCDYYVNCDDLMGGFDTRLRGSAYTVYTGLPGVAYMYWYLWQRLRREEHAEWCMKLGATSVEMMTRRMKFDQGEDQDRFERMSRILDEGDCTFLQGLAGTCSIMAAAFERIRGDRKQSQRMVTLLESMGHVLEKRKHIPDISNELMYGRAGWVYAALFVNAQKLSATVSGDLIDAIAERILHDGRRQRASFRGHPKPPLLWKWHKGEYLGGCHGVTGILRVLMDWENASPNVEKEIEQELRWLRDPCNRDGGAYSTQAGGSKTDLVQWCHGSTSVCMLMVEAFRKMRKKEYVKWAEECAEDIWSRGLLRKGVGLCHGISGNGYAFLKLYEATGDTKYLAMCLAFAQFVMQHIDQLIQVPDRPYSLFEGVSGCVVWMVDIIGAIRRLREDKGVGDSGNAVHAQTGYSSVFPSWDLLRL